MLCYVMIYVEKMLKKEKTQFQEQCSLYIVRNRSEPFWTIYKIQFIYSSEPFGTVLNYIYGPNPD